MMNRVSTVPRTPTSATSSILMSSPSTNSEAIYQVKQEDIEYQLLSPISASSPMHNGLRGTGGSGHHTKIIKVTPTAVARKSTAAPMYQTLNSGNDHEYFSTPITPSTGRILENYQIFSNFLQHLYCHLTNFLNCIWNCEILILKILLITNKIIETYAEACNGPCNHSYCETGF